MIRLRVVEGGRRSPKNERAGKGEINRVTISKDNDLWPGNQKMKKRFFRSFVFMRPFKCLFFCMGVGKRRGKVFVIVRYSSKGRVIFPN